MDKKIPPKSIDIIAVFQDAFNLYSKNIVVALVLGLISAIVSFEFVSWQGIFRGGISSLLFIPRSVITVSISSVLILYLHTLEKNKKASIGKTFTLFLNNYFMVTMVTSLALAAVLIGGFIFFIVPGILFAIWFSQTYYFLLLENKSPADAMRESKKLTEGRRITIVGIFLIQGIIGIAINSVVGKLLPEVAAAIVAIFPGTFLWFVDYVLYKKLKLA